jgi:hypothetical protein
VQETKKRNSTQNLGLAWNISRITQTQFIQSDGKTKNKNNTTIETTNNTTVNDQPAAITAVRVNTEIINKDITRIETDQKAPTNAPYTNRRPKQNTPREITG